MLPQLAAIPLQTTGASNDSGQNLNRLLPVGQNVSATVVAVSRDQIQPEIFRLKLEVNNRLIQMGVFQALPVGQKINVNRQSDGQIQITPQPQQAIKSDGPPTIPAQNQGNARSEQAPTNQQQPNLPKLTLPSSDSSAKIPSDSRIIAAVISSRPIYPNQATAQPTGQTQTSTTTTQGTPSPALQQSVSAAITPQTQIIANNKQPPVTQNNLQASTPSNSQPSPAITNSTVQQTGAPATAPGQSQTQPIQTQTAQPTIQSTTSSSTATNPAIAASNQSGTTNNPQPSTANKAGGNQASSQNPTQASPTSGNLNSNNNAAPIRPSSPPIHHVVTLALPDGSKVETISPKPLPQGAQIQLEKSSGQELQVLRLREPPLNPPSALDKPAIQEVLRNSLPNQIPPGTAFNQLAAAANSEAAQLSQISGVVRSMLQLFGVRPGSAEATTQIRNNVELGGYATERTLSKGFVPQPQEMRSQLSQLQQLAEKLPEGQRERLEQLLNGIQSRITSQQLTSLQQWRELPDGGFERVLQLDLPIKQGENWENLELRLSREGGSNAAGEMVSVWRVRLHFDLEELGGVDAEIRLTDGHEIRTLFWCEKPETAERLRQRSDEFSARLRECGFNDTEVNWHEGSAPDQKQVLHKQLVDLHT